MTKEPTLAQTLGFPRDIGDKSLFACYALTRDEARAQRMHEVAMDLARLCAISLQDATFAIGYAEGGQMGRLRRLGITLPDEGDYLDGVAAQVQGQAVAYSKTYSGSAEVRRATSR